ncbi:MAG TPA: protein kinase [Solirubrobacteraceae bacterium]|nr:protein kinase [Solirubrobacteraceae bacterium]
MPELTAGDVFADHRIEGLAGRGGMGVVYRATQLALERTVALKLIAPDLAEDDEFRERFVRESRAAASIEHPNVIPIYHAGERDGQLFIVMRYVEGEDLRARVRGAGRLEPADAARIVAQVGGALDAAHARGLVHRDVKPANVLLGAGDHAYLTDFGLTKRVTSQGGTTQAGGWVGTLGYVAPEQIRGERVDARVDVYALGCVLVHLLTGRAPFLRSGDEATLWAHLNDEPPGEADGVPAAFVPVVRRALAKQPADRFPSAGDLGRAALAAAGFQAGGEPERMVAVGAAAPSDQTRAPAGEPPTAVTALRRGDRPVRADADGGRGGAPRAALAAAAAVVLLALGGVAAAALVGEGDDPGPPQSTAPAAAGPAVPEVVDEVRVGPRPNALTLGRGYLWVGSGSDDDVLRFDGDSGKYVRPTLGVGAGVTDLHAAYRRLWVAKEGTRSLLRFDLKTGRRQGGAILLAGRPFALDSGEGAIWVAVRQPDGVVRVDRETGRQRFIGVDAGVRALAVGYDAVWVTNTNAATVTRIRISDEDQQVINVGSRPGWLSVGGGVWVANEGEETIARISPDTLQVTDFVDIGAQPARVASHRGVVWVSRRRAGDVVRVDTASREVIGDPIETGRGPFAIAPAREYTWVSVLNEDKVVRIETPER